jgi:hypothetical protein
MIFTIKGPIKDNIYNLMRKVGYFFQKEDKEKGEFVFVRPPKGYPRFHLYLKVDGSTSSPQSGEDLIFNLHLDQKRPVYEGTPAHSGEYEGKIVEKEAERIKEILNT